MNLKYQEVDEDEEPQDQKPTTLLSFSKCITCKSPEPLSSSKCSLILEGILALLPRILSSTFADTPTVDIIPKQQYCVILWTRKLKDHAYFRLVGMPLLTGALDVKSRDTQWGFEFNHSVIINIIMSNPEAALLKKLCTAFLIDQYLFSD